MLDDNLTLPVQPAPPAAVDGAVVLGCAVDPASDDPDNPRLRLYAALPHGQTVNLTPDNFNPPSVRLTTPLASPPIARSLTWGEPVACCLGVVDRDVAPGTTVWVGWTSGRAAAVQWGEVALLVEVAPPDFGFGNTPLARVGWADASEQFLGVSDVIAGVAVTSGIPRGSTLYACLIAQGSGTPPAVMGSPYPDPIGSGATLRLDPALNWRPSVNAGTEVWQAHVGTLPFFAAVRLP